MERILGSIQENEDRALLELVHLRDDVAAYYREAGKGTDKLRLIDGFKAFEAAKAITNQPADATHLYVLVSRAGNPDGQGLVHDVRFFVGLASQSYQVLQLVFDLLQFWEIFLRHHTNVELDEASPAIRASLRGRVTDTVFYEQVSRPLVPPPVPVSRGESPSVAELQAEISQRLGRVCFYFEERELLRPDLATYTGRTVESAGGKRAVTRIQEADAKLLYEAVHVSDTIAKWLHKQGRESELEVVQGFRPYTISANLVNVLKHGVRGRNHDCAVIDLWMQVFNRVGDEPAPDDVLLDVRGIVNFNGELFALNDLIEDVLQLWELFLRHHSRLDLTDFRVRVGKVLTSRIGLATYAAQLPPGLKAWAQQESDRRKRLDLR